MTLLVTVFAAIITSILWYKEAPKNEMRLATLCSIYWGAYLMWFVDAIFEYAELHAAYFTPGLNEMINDFYLGLVAVALGLIIWLAILMIKDPKNVVKSMLMKSK